MHWPSATLEVSRCLRTKEDRVLAIDDEPAMTEWLKILLEHEGYEVRTALIGTRGEEIFKTWSPTWSSPT